MEKKTTKYWLDRVRNELLTENQQKLYDNNSYDGKDGDVFSEFIPYKTKELCNENLSVTLESRYGGEGRSGEEYWYVFKFTDKVTNEEVYVKFDTYYQSYGDTEWDDEAFLVEPKEKTIIVYESVKYGK